MIQREAATRFIDLLTDPALTRALLLLRPEEHYQVRRIADTLAGAFPLKRATSRQGSIRKLKWQFIFRHLRKARVADHG